MSMAWAADQSTPSANTSGRFPFVFLRPIFPRMKANRSSNAKLVVVIEDDPLVLEATAGLLCSWGFKVIAAPCFENAMKQLSEAGRRPDLIVSDYRLSEGETGVDAIEGLRNAQRLMKIRTPKIGEVKIEPLIDSNIMRKLDESGFIDRVYTAHGVKP